MSEMLDRAFGEQKRRQSAICVVKGSFGEDARGETRREANESVELTVERTGQDRARETD